MEGHKRQDEVGFVGANKPDAVNPAMSQRLTIEDQWRRVTDLER